MADVAMMETGVFRDGSFEAGEREFPDGSFKVPLERGGNTFWVPQHSSLVIRHHQRDIERGSHRYNPRWTPVLQEFYPYSLKLTGATAGYFASAACFGVGRTLSFWYYLPTGNTNPAQVLWGSSQNLETEGAWTLVETTHGSDLSLARFYSTNASGGSADILYITGVMVTGGMTTDRYGKPVPHRENDKIRIRNALIAARTVAIDAGKAFVWMDELNLRNQDNVRYTEEQIESCIDSRYLDYPKGREGIRVANSWSSFGD